MTSRQRRIGSPSAAKNVLLVAGEASGDRLAAGVARALVPRGVRCWGMGGAATLAAEVELHADLRDVAAMGLAGVARRLPSVASAFARLAIAAKRSPPRAAVLVDYTEFNLRLARWLKGLDVPILWCVAPQVWAWRPGRTRDVARRIDRMATILPFETAIWRGAGVETHYVGHPALDTAPLPREIARATLGLAEASPNVALLPGSRAHEVRSHTDVMLTSVCEARRAGVAIDARLAIAASLDGATRAWLASRAAQANIVTFEADPERGAAPWLAAFDATLAVSGTATLESALAGTPPVILYRTSRLTALLARRFLKTPFIGLPNVVLGAPAYPEIVHDVNPSTVARALIGVLAKRSHYARTADILRAKLTPSCAAARGDLGRDEAHRDVVPIGNTCGERVASLLDDWLACSRPPSHGVTHIDTTPERWAPSP